MKEKQSMATLSEPHRSIPFIERLSACMIKIISELEPEKTNGKGSFPNQQKKSEDNAIWVHLPVFYFKSIGNPHFDWMFKTHGPTSGLDGRSLAWPRGKVGSQKCEVHASPHTSGSNPL